MPDYQDDQWWDEAAGPVVRPFAVTGGRTRSAQTLLDVATQVMIAHRLTDRIGLEPEHIAILELCIRPQSVAELAAYVNLPLMVVKVLIGDLIERGDVVIDSPARITEPPDRDILQAVLDGIRAL
ncbi:MAG TPA: DUF742 domain-containing protein [Pseudonocardiaceae bacterium]|jgi:hypothetical protein